MHPFFGLTLVYLGLHIQDYNRTGDYPQFLLKVGRLAVSYSAYYYVPLRHAKWAGWLSVMSNYWYATGAIDLLNKFLKK
jgi:hypothetical protein